MVGTVLTRRSAPLRVVLVADAVGGVWDVTLALAGGLVAQAGAAVLVVCVGPPPDAAREAAARAISGIELAVLGGQLEWMEGGRGWIEILRRETARCAAAWRADVVQLNAGSAGTGLTGIVEETPLSGARRQPALILSVHGDLATWWLWVKDGGRLPSTLPHHLRWQQDLAWQALRQADAVVCPSAFLAGELVRRYCLEARPHVIPNAVAPLQLQHSEVHREPDLAVVVGRAWDEAKNLALVARALQVARRGWRVEIAGDLVEPGRGPAALPQAPRLSYLGFLDKPALVHLFQRASLYIAPSSYEPFGLSPVEAALAGCAVVANDIPAFREIWGRAAAYFRRNDPQALAMLLDRLYDDPERIARLAQAAYRRAAGRYTVERMARRHLRLYQALLDGKAGRGRRPLALLGRVARQERARAGAARGLAGLIHPAGVLPGGARSHPAQAGRAQAQPWPGAAPTRQTARG